MKTIIYETFLYTVVILKFVYLLSTFIDYESKMFHLNSYFFRFIDQFKDIMYDVEEFLIHILLIILFNPFDTKIIITIEERNLLFVYGILGIIQDLKLGAN